MGLFQKSVLKKYKSLQDKKVLEKAFKKYAKYFHNPEIQQNIRESKEEQYQEGFLRELFVNILNYTINPNPNFNLTTELKNEKGAKKADGAILQNGKAITVIELKGTKTKDLESIRQQAFDYKANQSSCVYVITSNFEKLRFYIENAVEFEEFNLFTLNKEQFELLYLCLEKENILQNIPLKIKNDSLVKEEEITKYFYTDYSVFKRELFRDLVKQNMKNEVFRNELQTEDQTRALKNIKLSLFKKSQKLIDRFLFIFFAEDKSLLPPNSTIKILEQWNSLKDLDAYVPLYDRYKLYFKYLDTGRKGTDKSAEIFAYNGGLFKPDAVLDSLLIDDDLLYNHTKKLSEYDFESQVGVNILGHIFENSLNEIESVNAEIEGTTFDKQKTKRKKDGVFYTPKYITKYIVDNTVGKLCDEKKVELGVVEEEYKKSRKGRNKDTIKKLKTNLDNYRKWLLQITILDPACGSGAFLNQALDFLIKEHQYIDELETALLGGGIIFQNIENTILENNIFGVDLNEESVEIAKLSLWLRTAQPRRKLNSLNNNIKCGNSLIDDPKVAGDKAFNWHKEFPHIFKEKDKKIFHITTATHDSRTSQRMIDHKVRLLRDNGTRPKAEGIWIDPDSELLIVKTIAEIVAKDKLNILAFNICGDHMHLLLVCNEDDVTKIVGKIKAITAKAYNLKKGITKSESDTTRGHVPLSKEKKKTYSSLWTQKFGHKLVKDENQLSNTVEYIRKNRSKHELPQHNTETKKWINEICTDLDTALKPEFEGGFDVVIGNPPYVRQELFKDIKGYLEENYKCYNSVADLYTYFIEKGIRLMDKNGLFSFILPNKFLKATYGKQIRKVIKEDANLELLLDFDDYPVFADATTYPIIYVLSKNKKVKQKFFHYSEINKRDKTDDPIYSLETKMHNVSFDALTNDMWNFIDEKSFEVLTKLKANSISLEQLVDEKIFYGIKTGKNEAFIIDEIKRKELISKNPKNQERIKILATGKEVKRNTFNFQNKYLMFTGYDINIPNEYPDIINELDKFKEALIKRGDKGKNYWNLRSCAYYNEMQMSKIIYPRINNKGNFYLDEKGDVFLLDNNFFISTSSKALLALLNSKLVFFYLKNICTTLQGGFYDFRRDKVSTIPINKSFDINDKTLTNLSTILIKFTNQSNIVISNFTKYLQSQFNIEKLSKKLQNWHELAFGDFIKELNKAIIKSNKTRGHVPLPDTHTAGVPLPDTHTAGAPLPDTHTAGVPLPDAHTANVPLPAPMAKLTKIEEMEWMDVFETKKVEAQTLKAAIDKTDSEIDQMVYKLYELTEDEIEIIENATV